MPIGISNKTNLSITQPLEPRTWIIKTLTLTQGAITDIPENWHSRKLVVIINSLLKKVSMKCE